MSQLSFDPSLDAWHVATEIRIDTPEDLTAYEAQLDAGVQRFAGQPTFLLVDVSRAHVAPELEHAYGRVVQTFAKRLTGKVIRYGQLDEPAAAMMRRVAARNRSTANLFPTRADAIAQLERVRGL